MQTRRTFVTTIGRIAAAATLASTGLPAHAADTIKIGILHSLSGTMAISETSLKNVALMTIDEINARGGVMGKKLEAVVVDPASNWPLFAEKARPRGGVSGERREGADGRRGRETALVGVKTLGDPSRAGSNP